MRSRRMRGKPGTKVTITVVREGLDRAEGLDIVASRSGCSPSARHDLGGGIAYVKLRQFQEQSPW